MSDRDGTGPYTRALPSSSSTSSFSPNRYEPVEWPDVLPQAQQPQKRPVRPRSATASTATPSSARRSEDIGSSSRPLSQSRSRNRPPPLTPGQATKLSGSSSSHQRHGPCSTPTPPRSSFSTESTADSLRSRSLTVSSDNTTVYSGSQSFDQGTRPLKSHSTSSHRPHPGQRFGFPMPPTSTTAASSPLVPNDAIVWPNHHPTQPFNPSVSQSVVSVHEEPQSFLPRDTEYQSRRLANSGGSGSSHGGGGGSDSGSGSGSGWKAIARKASGKFKRSFSSSGSMINLAQEAEKHPMPTPPGSTVVTPTIEKTEPPGEATASTSPSPVSGSGFIGHMLSRKKSRDSLSDSGGRKPRPSWSDLPPSPSAPSTSAQTSSKPQPSTSSHGSGRTLKFGKSKQRWDQVPITPFELAPREPTDESFKDNGFLASPVVIYPHRRASIDASGQKLPRLHSLPRSASAQIVAMPKSHPSSPVLGSPTSSISRGSSVNSSPPPIFSDDDAPPPVPPLPPVHDRKSPITFNKSTSVLSNYPSGSHQLAKNADSPGRSSSSTASSTRAAAATQQRPSNHTHTRPAAIVPPPLEDMASLNEDSPTPHTARLPSTPTSDAVSPPRLRFPSVFGFVPRPDADEGPDSRFGASASAASAPMPYGLKPLHRESDQSDRQTSFLSTAASSDTESSSEHGSIIPPKRTQSLLPFSQERRHVSQSPPSKRDKTLEFEELLASDIGTMRLSLTPNRTIK